MDSYYWDSNNNIAISGISAEERFSLIFHLTYNLHPENAPDFASSFMNPDAMNHQPPPSKQPPWEDPNQMWRYVGEQVWTGEAMVWAPRPPPRSSARSDTTAVQVRSMVPAPSFPDTLPRTSSDNSNQIINSFIGDVTRPQELFVAPVRKITTPSFTQNHSINTPLLTLARSTDVSSPAPDHRQDTSLPAQEAVEWSDEDILQLYKWKIIKKKGNTVILSRFPGRTEESIAAAWKKYRTDGKRLYDKAKCGRRSSSYEG